LSSELLAAGYLHVDLIASVERVPGFGERVTAGSVFRSFGGMTANLACAAARLGLHTRFFGSAGRDPEGDTALEELEKFGVRTDGVSRTEGPTTTALVLLAPDGDRAIISEPTTFDYGPLEAAIEEPRDTQRTCLHLDGYRLPEALPLLHRARDLGLLTSADLDGMDPTELARVVPRISPALDVVFLNQRLSGALGSEPKAALARLLDLGAGTVAITLGNIGTLVGTPEETMRIPAPIVNVKDTTGAGDVFAGAFLSRWLEGEPVLETGRFAVLAAAYSVGSEGARGSLPHKKEVERMSGKIGEALGKGAVSNG
jgi:sulfofructose kinase